MKRPARRQRTLPGARWVARALLGGLALLLVPGCDLEGTPVPVECARIGMQCQLPGGPLGVCQERPCKAGETAPCFTCTSQH